jgi:uncharacterized coiled-coil protein SlyX
VQDGGGIGIKLSQFSLDGGRCMVPPGCGPALEDADGVWRCRVCGWEIEDDDNGDGGNDNNGDGGNDSDDGDEDERVANLMMQLQSLPPVPTTQPGTDKRGSEAIVESSSKRMRFRAIIATATRLTDWVVGLAVAEAAFALTIARTTEQVCSNPAVSDVVGSLLELSQKKTDSIIKLEATVAELQETMDKQSQGIAHLEETVEMKSKRIAELEAMMGKQSQAVAVLFALFKGALKSHQSAVGDESEPGLAHSIPADEDDPDLG